MIKELSIRLAGRLTKSGIDVAEIMTETNAESNPSIKDINTADIIQAIMANEVAKFANSETSLFDVAFWAGVFIGAKIFDADRRKNWLVNR